MHRKKGSLVSLVITWWKLSFKKHYLRKDRRKYGRDGRKRKKI
jgi:hypothetical protein